MPSDTNKRKLFGFQVPRHHHIACQLYVLPRLRPSKMLVRCLLTLGSTTNGKQLFPVWLAPALTLGKKRRRHSPDAPSAPVKHKRRHSTDEPLAGPSTSHSADTLKARSKFLNHE